MTELESVAGYLVAWSWRQARHAAGRADEAVTAAVDAGAARLHDLVVAKLGDDPALEKLALEAGTDLDVPGVCDRTRRRVVDALAEASENDPGFAASLHAQIDRLGVIRASVQGGEYGMAVGGSVSVAAASGGVAAQVIHGSVNTGNPSRPGMDRA